MLCCSVLFWTPKTGRRTKDLRWTLHLAADEGGRKLTVAVMAFWATFDDFGHPRLLGPLACVCVCVCVAVRSHVCWCILLDLPVLRAYVCALPPKSQNGGLKNRHRHCHCHPSLSSSGKVGKATLAGAAATAEAAKQKAANEISGQAFSNNAQATRRCRWILDVAISHPCVSAIRESVREWTRWWTMGRQGVQWAWFIEGSCAFVQMLIDATNCTNHSVNPF